MAPQTSIIGLGNRARNGKDYTAEYLQKKYDNVHIVHWADALKAEVRNKESINIIDETGERIYPLIYKDEKYYYLLDDIDAIGDYLHTEPTYFKFLPEEVPYLDEIFKERGIEKYWGDDDKDSKMLQFWGTDFRRTYINKNYWVNKTMESVDKIIADNMDKEFLFVLIPDTRFVNEYRTVKAYNPVSFYWTVIRYNEDGSRYYDDSRDPNHPSETELDEADYDYKTEAVSGDITGLYYQADKSFEDILNKAKNFKEYYVEEKN